MTSTITWDTDDSTAPTPVSSNVKRKSRLGILKNRLSVTNTNTNTTNTTVQHASPSAKSVHFHDVPITDEENVSPSLMVAEQTAPTTKLFALIKRKDWERVLERCEECPSEASVWIVEDNNYDGSLRWKLLPIHQACEMRPPEQVVSALLRAYPRGVFERDTGGSLPIHLACRERARESVIDILLSHCSKSVEIQDNEGRLPLHLACRQGVSANFFQELLRRFFRGAQIQDMDGMLPIHWACSQGASAGVIEALLRAYPDSVGVADKLSRVPTTIVQSSQNPEKEMILVALKRDVSYWTTSLQDEVSKLKSQLANVTLDEQSLREAHTDLKEKFNVVDTELESYKKDNAALQLENQSLRLRCEAACLKCDETLSQNKVLQETSDDLQKKVQELTSVLTLMKREQHVVRNAVVSIMRKEKGIVSNVAEDMQNLLRACGSKEKGP